MEFNRRYDGSLAVLLPLADARFLPLADARPVPPARRPLDSAGIAATGCRWKGVRPRVEGCPVGSTQPSATPGPARPVRSSLAALGPVLPSLRDALRAAPPGPGSPALPGRGPSGPPDPEQGRHPACAKADAPLPAKEASTAHRSDAHDR